MGHLWGGGSKLPALARLFEAVWQQRPASFEPLILAIVREGIKYRESKGNPVTREEVERISETLLGLHLKIPDLHDGDFLNSLPGPTAKNVRTVAPSLGSSIAQVVDSARLRELLGVYTALVKEDSPQARGYHLQNLVSDLFDLYGLAPKGAFRVVGEEIDGSFEFQGDTYLLEARWRKDPTSATDLYAFQEKVERKSVWTRGVFVSVNGFTADALEAFARGKAPRIFGFDGFDLAVVLEGLCSLDEALRRKIRALSESGTFLQRLS